MRPLEDYTSDDSAYETEWGFTCGRCANDKRLPVERTYYDDDLAEMIKDALAEFRDPVECCEVCGVEIIKIA